MRTETAVRALNEAHRVLAEHAAGRYVDPFSLMWARNLLAANPTPKKDQA
jgi:hypothetical protein